MASAKTRAPAGARRVVTAFFHELDAIPTSHEDEVAKAAQADDPRDARDATGQDECPEAQTRAWPAPGAHASARDAARSKAVSVRPRREEVLNGDVPTRAARTGAGEAGA